MDLIGRLPLECLQHILQTLSQQDNTSALATLLRVNKYIASVALPYLYSEPFRPHFHNRRAEPTSTGGQSRVDPAVSAEQLTRMLLGRGSVKDLPRAVTLAFNLDPNTPGKTNSPIEYFAHIRDLCLERWSTGPHYSWDFKDPSAEVQEYIQTDKFKALCHMDRLCPDYARRFKPETKLLFYYFRVILNREANWALASPILGQVRTLTIPISDIGRYLRVVDRLESLEHVRFRLDEAFDYGPREATTLDAEFTRATRMRKDKVMQDLVRFVREHCQHFKGTIKTATFSDSGLWPWIHQSFPEEIQFKVFQILPPLHKPKELLRSNWLQFTAHPLSTDLGQLKQIAHRRTVGPSFDRLRENKQFLQSCRTLNHLDIPSLGQGSFNWAAQEKRIMDGLDSALAGGQGTTLLDPDRPACLQHGLVPLEYVEIREYKEPFTDEVDDIAFGFSRTLTKLKADASSFILELPRSIRFGRGWVDLPVLRQLSLNAKNARLVIDRRLLVHCPNVSFIDLTDQTFQYRCQDLEPCLPAQLPRLQTMTLTGWAALTFHPDTLHSTSNLTFLGISTFVRNDECYIPPVEELDHSYGITRDNDAFAGTGGMLEGPTIIRPYWSWNWHLPNLNSLFLTSEFAYKFEFRMLRGCPAMQVLDVNLSTVDGEHSRTITMSDLFAPASSNNDDEDDSDLSAAATGTGPSSSSERIVVPTLRTLRLVGHWMMEDEFLPEFLGITFPNLQYLTEKQWGGGVTVAGLLRFLRGTPNKDNIKQLDLSLPEPSAAERIELGMTGVHIRSPSQTCSSFFDLTRWRATRISIEISVFSCYSADTGTPVASSCQRLQLPARHIAMALRIFSLVSRPLTLIRSLQCRALLWNPLHERGWHVNGLADVLCPELLLFVPNHRRQSRTVEQKSLDSVLRRKRVGKQHLGKPYEGITAEDGQQLSTQHVK
ncbi:hypothetical protein BGX23_002886 [Mortierella sp. AD031]|nr:hypothetical protein BGX23_002886 [Mortierella sp. AD031]